MVQLLWKTVWRLLEKLKKEVPYDPAIPLPDRYPKEPKAGAQYHVHTLMLSRALSARAEMRKQPPSAHQQTNGQNVAYPSSETVFSHKKRMKFYYMLYGG